MESIKQLTIKLNGIANNDFSSSLSKIALFLESEVKRNLTDNDSVVTGQLRRSITAEVKGNQASALTNVSYAPYVEYGTGIYAEKGDGRKDRWCYQTADGEWHSTLGQPPQPFMRPALYNNKDKIMDILKAEIMEGLKK